VVLSVKTVAIIELTHSNDLVLGGSISDDKRLVSFVCRKSLRFFERTSSCRLWIRYKIGSCRRPTKGRPSWGLPNIGSGKSVKLFLLCYQWLTATAASLPK